MRTPIGAALPTGRSRSAPVFELSLPGESSLRGSLHNEARSHFIRVTMRREF